MVEDARQTLARIDRETGKIRLGDLSAPEVDEVFYDLVELVLSTKREVVVVSSEQMLSATGVAAKYRF